MRLHTRSCTIIAFAASLMLFGCGEHGHEDDHDHEDEHEDEHEHEDGEDHEDEHEGHGEHDDHGHEDEEHELGDVKVGETELEIFLGGEIEPGAALHVDIVHLSGPMPANVRAWIGDQSGVGVLKGKGEGSGGRWHADTEVPVQISSTTKFWIESEDAAGNRNTASLPLQ